MEYKFDSIEEIVEEIRKGHCVIMQDAENRENEGDYICAAEFATPENVNLMASEAKGVICMPLDGEIADRLFLGPMIRRNTDNHHTAFLESIDYVGTGTGVSASDRSMTALKAVADDARPEEFRRPGHLFPLRAKKWGSPGTGRAYRGDSGSGTHGRAEAGRTLLRNHESRRDHGPQGRAVPAREGKEDENREHSGPDSVSEEA